MDKSKPGAITIFINERAICDSYAEMQARAASLKATIAAGGPSAETLRKIAVIGANTNLSMPVRLEAARKLGFDLDIVSLRDKFTR